VLFDTYFPLVKTTRPLRNVGKHLRQSALYQMNKIVKHKMLSKYCLLPYFNEEENCEWEDTCYSVIRIKVNSWQQKLLDISRNSSFNFQLAYEYLLQYQW